MQAEYRPIEGFPGYRVGNDGSVWSCWEGGSKPRQGDSWHKIKQRTTKWWYSVVTIYKDRKKHNIFVHKLVLRAFVGPKPPGMECRHKNGKPSDNRSENLLWGTKLENADDKRRHGTMRGNKGVKNGRAKLNPNLAARIRFARREGYTVKALAMYFKVSETTISNVVRGVAWTSS
jgi:hypothetical protein